MALITNRGALCTSRVFPRADEVELAEALIDELSSDGQLVFTEGDMYQYSEELHYWVRLPPDKLSRVVMSFAGAPLGFDKEGNPKGALKITASKVKGTIECASNLLSKPDFFGSARSGIVFRNAFVCATRDGIQLFAHSPEHRARCGYAFDYDPDAVPNLFLEFLRSCFAGDGDAVDKMMLATQYPGVSLLGRATAFQKILIAKGDGANGKGVFTQVVDAAMPEGSTCALPPQKWDVDCHRARLVGKLLNLVPELPESDILCSETFKAVVAGDKLVAKKLYQQPFDMVPVAGHICAANRLPATKDPTHGFWRRPLILLFERIFAPDEQDLDLAKKIIETELPAVVSLLVRCGQLALRQGHFTVPASSDRAVAEWRKSADQVRAFLDECCVELDPSAPRTEWTRATPLYEAYKTWAREAGHFPFARNNFGARLAAAGHGSGEDSEGNFYRLKLVRPTMVASAMFRFGVPQ